MQRIAKAYERGELVLVLGAGCSLSATNFQNENLPSGPALAEKLCIEFGTPYENESLPEVIQSLLFDQSQYKISKFISEKLRVKEIGNEHLQLARLHCRRIYILNTDDAVERAFYKHSEKKISVFHKGDAVKSPALLFDEIQIIKIHGCVSRPDDGFIFSLSDYDKAHGKLPLWYSQLAADCLTSTVVFIGTQANEPILFDAISRIDPDQNEARSYLVIPELSENRQRIAKSRGMTWVPGKFSDLLEHLQVSGCFDIPAIELAKRQEPSVATLLDQHNENTSQLLARLRDVIPVKFGIRAQSETPKSRIRAFYEGYRADASDYDDFVPANLDQVDRLVDTIRSAINSNKLIVAVTGAAGTGKVTALHLAARRLVSLDKTLPVFFLARDAEKPISALEALSSIYKSRILVFVESLFEARDTIRNILTEKNITNILFVSAEPSNSWTNIISHDFDSELVQTIEFSHITHSDAKKLLEKLEKFGPWTALSKLSAEKRIETILEKSQKQLLVGLLEATQGRGYTDIIRQDYESVSGLESRFLLSLACVCTMFGRGAPLDVSIRAFRAKFPQGNFATALRGLDGTARVADNFVEARHPVYATAIFETLLTAQQKFDAIYYTLQAFAAYGSPVPLKVTRDKSRIFKGIFNYRFLHRTFENQKDLILSMFQKFETIFHSDGAYWLQYGLALRKFGDNRDALKMIERSVQAYPSNFAHHALGLQYFINVNEADTPVEANECLEKACQTLRSIDADVKYDDAYPVTTLAKGHVTALIRMGQNNEARQKAQGYVDEISRLQKRKPRDRVISELYRNLVVLATTGSADDAFWNISEN